MNRPTKYTHIELIMFRARVAEANAPESMVNVFNVLGPYSRTAMTNSGPCLPTSLAIATGQTLDEVFDKMQPAYASSEAYKGGSVLDGTLLTMDEVNAGVPAVAVAATKGVPNCDLIKRRDLEGRTLSELVKSGRTFVVLVAGGAHALCVKGGRIYCTAGRTFRAKSLAVWEVV